MQTTNTHGEAFIVGKVSTGKGKFIKRDKIVVEANLEDITDLEEDFDFDLDEFEEDFDLDELEEAEAPPNVNTGGGKYIPGNVNTKGKDFVGNKRK